jgi:hypothetical protein
MRTEHSSMRVIRVTADLGRARPVGVAGRHPLTTEAWGIRRFFVRAPGGTVLNIAQHHDPDE